MSRYKVKVSYSFICEWEIEADNKAEAREFAVDHCCAISPNFQSSITDEWVGDVHPYNESVKSIKLIP